jgi:hypothetical protein
LPERAVSPKTFTSGVPVTPVVSGINSQLSRRNLGKNLS